MPSGLTPTGLPSASPTPSHSSTARRATARAMASAISSVLASGGSASTAGSARADTISAVVSGRSFSRTPGSRSSQRGSWVRSKVSMSCPFSKWARPLGLWPRNRSPIVPAWSGISARVSAEEELCMAKSSETQTRLFETTVALEIVRSERDHLRAQVTLLGAQLDKVTERA